MDRPQKINFILSALIGLSLLGCRELTEIDLPEETPRLVVEGELTDTPGPHLVRLTLTQPYFSDEPVPAVEDAEVWIQDDAGQREQLQYWYDGYYITQSLQGEIGRRYTLDIHWQGMDYQASGSLLPEPIIDSLEARFYEANPPALEEGYYILINGRLPTEASRYYRIKVYDNDSLYNDRTDLLIPDDRFLPDTLSEIRLIYAFDPGDTVRMEMYTLDQAMYNYYIELRNLLFNDGGLFSPPPRNPVGNVHNLTRPEEPPLGYFQVASFSTDTVVIPLNGQD